MFSSKGAFRLAFGSTLFMLASAVALCAALLLAGCARALDVVDDDAVAEDEGDGAIDEEVEERLFPTDVGALPDLVDLPNLPDLSPPRDSVTIPLDAGCDTGVTPIDSGACICSPGTWLPTGCNDHVCSYGNTGQRCNGDCRSLGPCDMLPSHSCVIPDAGWAALEIQFEARSNFGSMADIYFRAPPLDGGLAAWSRMRCRGTIVHYAALDTRRDVYICRFDPTGLPWTYRGEVSGSTLSFFVAIRTYPDWTYLAACPPDHSSVCTDDPFINRFRVLLNGAIYQGAPQLWAIEDSTVNATVINFRFP